MTSSINDNWRISDNNDNGQSPVVYNFKEVEDGDFPCIIPSSPNWYCNSILHCLNGHCAFGGKNAVYVFDMTKKPPVCQWGMNGTNFSLRVTAVTLVCSQELVEDSVDMLAYASEDGHVRIVNLETKNTFKEHKRHAVRFFCLNFV